MTDIRQKAEVEARKTKPCPACGHELNLPTEYLNAYGKVKEKCEDFLSVMQSENATQAKIIETLAEKIAEYHSAYEGKKHELCKKDEIIETLEGAMKRIIDGYDCDYVEGDFEKRIGHSSCQCCEARDALEQVKKIREG